jgi:hypothetical protein
MAKKRKIPKLTAEDHARHAEHQRMARERIAYRRAKELEQEEAQRRANG